MRYLLFDNSNEQVVRIILDELENALTIVNTINENYYLKTHVTKMLYALYYDINRWYNYNKAITILNTRLDKKITIIKETDSILYYFNDVLYSKRKYEKLNKELNTHMKNAYFHMLDLSIKREYVK